MSSSMKTDNTDTSEQCKISGDFEILRQSPIFSGVDNEVLKLFAYLAQRKKFDPGEPIITSGKEAEAAYYLITGLVEIKTSHRHREVVLQQLKPHAFCGELALLARFKWFFSAYALEKCEVLMISRESFQKILERFPEKKDNMIEQIVQLRIQRLKEQTSFLLDKLSDSCFADDSSTT